MRIAARSSHPRMPRAISGSRRIRRAERSAGTFSLSRLIGSLILWRSARGAPGGDRGRGEFPRPRGRYTSHMVGSAVLLAALISLHAAPAPAAGQKVYRSELPGKQSLLSEDPP